MTSANPAASRCMSDAEFGWREALRAIAELLQAFLARAHAAGVAPAKAQVNVSDLLVLVKRHQENPPMPFVTPDVEALRAELAGWKKGVEDANRISQRECERAERAEAALETTRPRTDALYEVLGAARALMAVQLREERNGLAWLEGTDAGVQEVSDGLQRLRDTLHETRGMLLRPTGGAA